jgi:hypothetical protein
MSDDTPLERFAAIVGIIYLIAVIVYGVGHG